MKASTLLLLAASAVEAFAAQSPRDDARQHITRMKSKRQALAMMTTMAGKGGKVSGGWGDATRVVQTPLSAVPGSKRTKMRYGPYSVIGMKKTSILGEGGALWNYPDTSVDKPESSEFTIFGMRAGLEYPNGTDANIDDGMWLHHMVQFNIGWGRADATCAGTMSLPHFDVGTSPTGGERMFSSGNERSYADLTINGPVNVGYNVKPADYWALIVDLMNMNMEDRTVYMTITYDYVMGQPAGWDDLKPVWFDVNQCGTSEVSALSNSGAFQIESKEWYPNFEGEVMGMGAHVHDGGIRLEVLNGPNSVVCNSVATYGGDPKYITPQRILRMNEGKPAVKHISHMGMCYNKDLKPKGLNMLKKSQRWTVKAYYDYNQAPGNVNELGNQEEIMAISIMYVRVPKGGVSLDMWLGASAANPSMGATGASIFSNMASNLGLGSLMGGGSKSSDSGLGGLASLFGGGSSSSSSSSSSMAGMNMKRKVLSLFGY